MEAYKERVIQEKAELDVKWKALTKFRQTKQFTELSADEQELLILQGTAMAMYSSILGERISRF